MFLEYPRVQQYIATFFFFFFVIHIILVLFDNFFAINECQEQVQILFQRNVQFYILKEPSVIENALILKSVIVQSSSFRRACYLLPLSTVPVPMPTESSKLQGEFQIFLGQTNLIGTLFNACSFV